jgi:hypothetical protein
MLQFFPDMTLAVGYVKFCTFVMLRTNSQGFFCSVINCQFDAFGWDKAFFLQITPLLCEEPCGIDRRTSKLKIYPLP